MEAIYELSNGKYIDLDRINCVGEVINTINKSYFEIYFQLTENPIEIFFNHCPVKFEMSNDDYRPSEYVEERTKFVMDNLEPIAKEQQTKLIEAWKERIKSRDCKCTK